MPAALTAPTMAVEERVPMERRSRERRPSGGAAAAASAADAADAADVRVLLALPLHAVTLSPAASAPSGARLVVSVAWHGQSALTHKLMRDPSLPPPPLQSPARMLTATPCGRKERPHHVDTKEQRCPGACPKLPIPLPSALQVARPHAPPGVSADRPMQLELTERWRRPTVQPH